MNIAVVAVFVLMIGLVAILVLPAAPAEASSRTFAKNSIIALTDQVIKPGETWTINPGVELKIGSITVNNSGTINNRGSIVVEQGTIINNNLLNNSGSMSFYSGTIIINNGTILNNPGSSIVTNYASIINKPGKTIINSGSIVNTGQVPFDNYGTLNNYGIIDNAPESTINNIGTINNYCGAIFNNQGGKVNGNPVTYDSASCTTFTADVTITSDKTISIGERLTINHGVKVTIAPGVTVTNNGTIINLTGGQIANSGTIINLAGGVVDSSGIVDNYGAIKNSGSFKALFFFGTSSIYLNNHGIFNNSGSFEVGYLINNYGSLYNYGAIFHGSGIYNHDLIYNYGTITNIVDIYNYAAINNNSNNNDNNVQRGTIDIDNTIQNYGTLNNSGTINTKNGFIGNHGTINNNPGGIINNDPGGRISNLGIINNFGTVNNYNVIENPCGAIFNNQGGEVKGNPIDEQLCSYTLDLFEGNEPSDLIFQPGGLVKVVAGTNDRSVHSIQLVFQSTTRGSIYVGTFPTIPTGNMEQSFLEQSISTPTLHGNWILQADFLSGNITKKTLTAALFVSLGDGGPGDDNLVGTDSWDFISGEGGNDIIKGLAGSDNLFGRTGNDVLYGGMGRDRLSGGPGDDDLVGEPGGDSLTGGLGSDFFDCGPGIDTITDFSTLQGDTKTANCENVIPYSKLVIWYGARGPDMSDSGAQCALKKMGLTIENRNRPVGHLTGADIVILDWPDAFTQYSSEEVDAMKDYVNNGGRLIISADTDYFYCNPASQCALEVSRNFGFAFNGDVSGTIVPAGGKSSHPIWNEPNKLPSYNKWCCDAYVSQILDVDNVKILARIQETGKPAIIVNNDPDFDGGKVIGTGRDMFIGSTNSDFRMLENIIQFMLSS